MIWIVLALQAFADDPAIVVADDRNESPSELEKRLEEMEARLNAIESQVEDGPVDRHLGVSAGTTEGENNGVSYSGPLVVALGQSLAQAVSFGGPVDVQGTVLGDAVSMGSDIIVRSTGVVEGNAVSVGGRVVVEPGGQVEGDQVALGETSGVATVAGAFGDASPGGMVRGVFRQLSVLSCLMGAGVLLMGLWPQNVERVARPIGDRPFWYGVAGAILTGCSLVGTGLLAVTFVGLPLALLLTVVLAVAWLLGVVAVSKAIGERFAFTEQRGAWAAFLTGALILGAVSLVPYVGPLLVILVGFPAVGASLLTRLGNRRAA